MRNLIHITAMFECFQLHLILTTGTQFTQKSKLGFYILSKAMQDHIVTNPKL